MTAKQTVLLASIAVILPAASVSAVAPGSSIVAATSESGAEPDLEGRTDLLNRINVALDEKDFDLAESYLEQFRSSYPASSGVKGWDNGNEVVYLFPTTSRLAAHYEREGDLKKALQIYQDEVNSLSIDVPHYSYGFVGAVVPLLLELGSNTPDECRTMLLEYRAKFERRAGEVEHPGRKSLYEGLVSRMNSALSHLDLIGKKAPPFTFVRALNTELPLALDDLKGKVILIDFWATWCAPCMEAWPSLRELYDRHKERGLEILGVTSVEGSYSDLSAEQEIELAGALIEKHEVPWPILFSDRAVNDPEYAATTLPSYAIIDRAGNVAAVLVGDYEGLGETLLERLLRQP